MPPPTWHFHRAFGLHIAASSTLAPYFEESEARPDGDIDLRVEIGTAGDRTPDSLEVDWPGLVRVHAQAGRRLWVTALATLPEAGVAEMVSGPVIAVALAQRGLFVLHGSAVDSRGRVVVFCGHSGAGKSTMAAMFAAAGARSFSDDIVPLSPDGAGVVVQAGPTLAKLTVVPPAARPFFRELGSEALGEKTLCKWHRTAAPGERGRLAAVLVLQDGDHVGLKRLRGQEAVSELLRHSFCLATAGLRRQAEQLETAVAVASAVPVMRLARPRTMAGATDAVAAVQTALHTP